MSFDHRSPTITLGSAEHHQLAVLAMVGRGHTADDSDYLNYELDRARVVPDHRVPADTVRMGSIVTYRSGDGGMHTVELVYPDYAIARDKVSVLSPVGTALIGLTPGQTITWRGPNGAAHKLTVISVANPGRGRAADAAGQERTVTPF